MNRRSFLACIGVGASIAISGLMPSDDDVLAAALKKGPVVGRTFVITKPIALSKGQVIDGCHLVVIGDWLHVGGMEGAIKNCYIEFKDA